MGNIKEMYVTVAMDPMTGMKFLNLTNGKMKEAFAWFVDQVVSGRIEQEEYMHVVRQTSMSTQDR